MTDDELATQTDSTLEMFERLLTMLPSREQVQRELARREIAQRIATARWSDVSRFDPPGWTH